MLSLDLLRQRKADIIELAQKYGAYDVRVFGSVARGDADDQSDIDFLVRFEPGRSLLDQGGLLMDLRGLFGARVDVVSEGTLSGPFGKTIRREARPLDCVASVGDCCLQSVYECGNA